MEALLEFLAMCMVLVPFTLLVTLFVIFMCYIQRKENSLIAQIQEQSEVQNG